MREQLEKMTVVELKALAKERHVKLSAGITKQGIIDRSDIIIAMPGSVGTLDEVFTVLAANTIGIHSKRVLFWNIDGFWDELFQMFRALERRNVINKPLSDYVLVANTFDELIRLVE
jgi:predicted Rossmann-fold nucleotide-binding protein